MQRLGRRYQRGAHRSWRKRAIKQFWISASSAPVAASNIMRSPDTFTAISLAQRLGAHEVVNLFQKSLSEEQAAERPCSRLQVA